MSAALRHAALRELFSRCLALNGGVFSPARIPQQGLRHRWRELLHPAELWDWVEASRDFEWVRPMCADPQIRWATPRAASGAITVALAGRLTADDATAVALAVPAAAAQAQPLPPPVPRLALGGARDGIEKAIGDGGPAVRLVRRLRH